MIMDFMRAVGVKPPRVFLHQRRNMRKGLDVRENLSCWEMAVTMAVTETGRRR